MTKRDFTSNWMSRCCRYSLQVPTQIVSTCTQLTASVTCVSTRPTLPSSPPPMIQFSRRLSTLLKVKSNTSRLPAPLGGIGWFVCC